MSYDIRPLHRPKWQLDDDGAWRMLLGNKSVAWLVPVSCSIVPWANWLSQIHPDYPSYGWDNVDFATLIDAQHVLEQWWFCMCRHQAFQG